MKEMLIPHLREVQESAPDKLSDEVRKIFSDRPRPEQMQTNGRYFWLFLYYIQDKRAQISQSPCVILLTRNRWIPLLFLLFRMDALTDTLHSFPYEDVYPSLQQKAARLCFGLVKNHPFIDGNKRIGTHAMLVFLTLNGIELDYLFSCRLFAHWSQN